MVDGKPSVGSASRTAWRISADVRPASSALRAMECTDPSRAAPTAIPIGLIVHEIVTNALKHAFTAMGRGRLRVTLRAEPDGEVCLSIQDDGPGLPSPSNPLSAGSMGMQIVHSLARQIDGSVSTESGNGTTFHVRFRSPDSRIPHTDTHTKGR